MEILHCRRTLAASSELSTGSGAAGSRRLAFGKVRAGVAMGSWMMRPRCSSFCDARGIWPDTDDVDDDDEKEEE